jgi:hypothetical protein
LHTRQRTPKQKTVAGARKFSQVLSARSSPGTAQRTLRCSNFNKENTMDNSNGTPGVNTTPDDVARRVKDSASHAIDKTKEAATQQVEQGAERVAAYSQRTASALRRAADDVEGENTLIGKALRKSADGIEQATRSLSGGDINATVEEVNSFARRQPGLFLGASFALGFALARVGKTAIEQNTSPRPDDETLPPMTSY